MDSDTFEALIEKLSAAAYRRDAVKGLIGGALASVSAISITSAKGGKHKHKGKGRDGKNRHGGNGRSGGKGKAGGNGGGRKQHGNGGGNGQDRNGSGAARRKQHDTAQDTNGVQSQGKKRCKKNGKNCSRQQALSAL